MSMISASLLMLGFFATSEGSHPFTGRPEVGFSLRDGLKDEKAKEAQKNEMKRKPKFTISKETTYVTGPRDKDGYIDYAAALNERLSKGVTPENNANGLLWKALGPHPEGGNIPPELFQWMGIESPPERGEYFIDLRRYLKERLRIDAPERIEELELESSRAGKRPWKPEQHPQIAAWLKANEKPLAVAFAATKRSHYFLPLIPTKDKKGASSGLIGAPLSSVQKCRELATAFVARAMLHVGEDRYDNAWQDLLACHRLGRLLGQGGTLIEYLVGVAIDTVASNADLAYAAAAELTSGRIMDCLRDLQRLPPMPEVADKVEFGERFLFLDCVIQVDRHGIKYLEGLSADKQRESKFTDLFADFVLGMIDWGDPALRTGNRWYDRMVAAMRQKDRSLREKQLKRIEEDLNAMKKDLLESIYSGRLGAAILGEKDSASALGKAIGEILVGLMVPGVLKVHQASDRIEQVHRNLYLAFALAAYQRDHGRYPMNLEALAPKYLAQIPQDIFTGKSLIYRPSEHGYLLYSFGPNGRDDQGRWFDDDPPGDDPSVRMPLPKLKEK